MNGQGVFVITGPSGAGKNTIIERIRKEFPQFRYAVSATTRPPRDGEVEGQDYYFLSPEEFRRRVAQGKFLEHAPFAGYQYGMQLQELERGTDREHPVVLDVEIQGARNIRRKLPESTQIFVSPPSVEALRSRLARRKKDSEDQIRKRLETAERELTARGEFDREVINDDLDAAVAEITEFIRSRLQD
jgi:guanylate kinase